MNSSIPKQEQREEQRRVNSNNEEAEATHKRVIAIPFNRLTGNGKTNQKGTKVREDDRPNQQRVTSNIAILEFDTCLIRGVHALDSDFKAEFSTVRHHTRTSLTGSETKFSLI